MTSSSPVVSDMFGSRSPLAEEYAKLLCTDGIERGLIGPREADRIWNRHILNSALLCDILLENSTVADIGSGAGLPGIPVAVARPDLEVFLIEPLLRRVTFLNEAVEKLGLENVTVIRGRAEEKTVQQKVGKVDFITSRAVAPLAKLAKWSAPFADKGSYLVALKGSSAAEEIERDANAVGIAGWRNEEVVQLHRDGGVDDTYVIRAIHI